MAEKPFKLEIEYFGVKVSKKLDKLEDAVGLTLSLGPFVKVGIRDMRLHSSFHTTVSLYQHDPERRLPRFKFHSMVVTAALAYSPFQWNSLVGAISR